MELIRQYKSSQAKERKKEMVIEKMREKINSLKEENEKLKLDLTSIKKSLNNISEKLNKFLIFLNLNHNLLKCINFS